MSGRVILGARATEKTAISAFGANDAMRRRAGAGVRLGLAWQGSASNTNAKSCDTLYMKFSQGGSSSGPRLRAR